jgi:hypothetical protein
MRVLLVLSCIWVFSTKYVQGQINLRVGYSFGVFEPEATNAILESYNVSSPWLDRPFEVVRLVNGLTFGARYRLGPVGLEGFWSNKFLQRTSSGTTPGSNQFISQQLNLSINSYSAGIQLYFTENLSFGGSADASRYQIRKTTNPSSTRTTLVQEPFFSSHVYLSAELRANHQMSISFRPYAMIPWSKPDISSLEHGLQGSSSNPQSENLFHFGIMLVFYNGPH